VSLAPEILIRRDARWLRDQPAALVPPLAERRAIVAWAIQQFTSGTVKCGGLGSQDAAGFRSALWAGAGLPAALTRRWSELLASQVAELSGRGADQDRPALAEPDAAPGAEPVAAATGTAGGRPVLTLVGLPGNTFTCLESVIEAVLSGSAVWVRPSTREPLSALRLVSALLDAGWPGELTGFYPTARAVLRALVAVTDRQIIYGGADVRAELRGVRTATVHGPLRVCAVVPQAADPAAVAAELLPLIAGDGGRFCTTVRAILCRADPAPVAARLAALLDAIQAPPSDPDLPLAASPGPELAAATETAVLSRLGPGDQKLTGRPILSQAGRLTYLAPTLIRLADQPEGAQLAWGDPALLGFEAPFPLATVSKVSPAQAAALASSADLVHRLPAARTSRGRRAVSQDSPLAATGPQAAGRDAGMSVAARTGRTAAGTGRTAAGTGRSAAGTGRSAAGTGRSAAGTGRSAAGTGPTAAGRVPR
jgi:hypothetical protein